jgi:hypothetical protein
MISPFSFGDDGKNFEDTVSALCTITKGDLPMNVYWMFTSTSNVTQNLTSSDGVIIIRNSQKISSLNIDSVQARNRGNYTCIASNKAGVAQHSAFLHVNGYYTNFFLIFLEFCDLFPVKSFTSNCTILIWRRRNEYRRINHSNMYNNKRRSTN